MALPVVAIVGSPNVGKSTIFNRVIGERRAIVDDERGVTRDRLYAKTEWLTREFRIIDTGGIELANKPFQVQIRAQAEIAIEEADVIVFITDGQVGLSGDDQLVAKLLYKSNKPIVLAVNKIDDISKLDNASEFYALGLGDPIAVSGAHGIGIGDLLDQIIHLLPTKEDKQYENAICFSVIGRPNVGKSTLVNCLTSKDRVIVSDIEGTTRDAIDVTFTRNNQDYVVIDTAGLKKKGKIYESIDKYAALRAMSAIDRSDVVLLVIDAFTGVREQDKHIAGYALELKKAIVIIVNKWDLIKKDHKTMDEFKKNVIKEFKFMDYAPVVFISAMNGSRIDNIFSAINLAFESYTSFVKTNVLNEIVQELQIMNPAPHHNGGRLKIYYANQVAIKPPTFVLFTNNEHFAHFSYVRYVENNIRNKYEFAGTPINIILRTRK